MGLYSKYFLVEISGLIFAFVFAVYLYLKYVAFNYWSSKNIDCTKPVVPVGSLWPVVSGKASVGELLRETYLKFKKSPVCGFYSFHRPTLLINDPDLIRTVLTKEFAHFHDRGMYCNEKLDPLSGHLFFLSGARWKYLRAKFSPTFTSSKMKQMFFTVTECSETLVKCLADKAKEGELVEVKDLMARFATDIIASTAFGLQCNSLENPDTEFRTYGRKVLEPRIITTMIALLAPQLFDTFQITPTKKDISDFFINTFKETVKYRMENNVVRKDFLDLAIQLMKKGHVDDNDEKESANSPDTNNEKITMLEGAAQAFVFWIAGFETSSTTATNCLYELALHQDIQDKVAEEVNSTLEEFGGLTYEGLKKMRYLDQVVSETLRKYPAVPMLNRVCTKEFTLPGNGFRVPKGTPIIIPVYGLHWDPDIYPDPEVFDPERFDTDKVTARHAYAYLPFGEGPRNCIGMRFGLVQTKIGLLSLISKYRFTPGPDLKVPMQTDRGSVTVGPAGGMILRIEQR